jgi:polyisoprenoid-binding protein YceI
MISPNDLQRLLAQPEAPALLHVLPPEIFAAQHIPGSLNACVYETAFTSKVQSLLPNSAAPVVVYGAGEGSLDAQSAAERLRAADYTQISVFEGGLAAWQSAGFELAGTGQLPQSAPPHGTFKVDVALSQLRWTGCNLFNHHHGTLQMSGGVLQLRHGELVSGEFSVDMSTMVCEDLADSAWNSMLIGHLQDADFFDVQHYPTADFHLHAVEPVAGATEGTAQWLVHGVATIRGISQPLSFPAVVAATEEGNRITAQAQLEIDRTQFGSHYGSGRLFRFLGKHVVNDSFHLHVKLHADRV